VQLTFFFSSRRRHTNFSRDWSSDVCSSDLSTWSTTGRTRACPSQWRRAVRSSSSWRRMLLLSRTSSKELRSGQASASPAWAAWRSEERREGKERRHQEMPNHYKLKHEE